MYVAFNLHTTCTFLPLDGKVVVLGGIIGVIAAQAFD